jgi:DNA repair exonuclease SbcCD nuclease subunit
MNRFIVTGDLQLQKGPRFEDACKALQFISTYAYDNKIYLIYILGDIYERNDIVAGSEEEVVFAKFLLRLVDIGANIFIMTGNHDIIDGSHNVLNSIRLLGDQKNIHVITHPYVEHMDTMSIHIPYIHRSMLVEAGKSYREYFIDTARALLNKLRRDDQSINPSINPINLMKPILFTHCDIIGVEAEKGRLPKVDTPTADDIFALGVDICFSGHIHKHQVFFSDKDKKCKTPIVYCGSPLHTTFASGNDPKGFIDVNRCDDGTCNWNFIQVPSRRQIEIECRDGKIDKPYIDVNNAMIKLRLIYKKGEYDVVKVDEIKKDLYSAGAHYVKVVPIQESMSKLQDIKVDDASDMSILIQYLADVKGLPMDSISRLQQLAEKYMGGEV